MKKKIPPQISVTSQHNPLNWLKLAVSCSQPQVSCLSVCCWLWNKLLSTATAISYFVHRWCKNEWWDVYCPYAAPCCPWCLSSLKKMKVGWTTNVRGQQRYLYINHFSVNSVFLSENSFNALTPGDNLIPVWSRLECSFSFVERPKSDGSRSKPAANLQ